MYSRCQSIRPITLPLRAIALLLFLCPPFLTLSGCTSWYMMTSPSGEPVDQNRGERTLGSTIEDLNIEAKIRANLLKANREYHQSDITVTSYNGIVLLTGTVKTQALKRLATELAQNTRHVRQVQNRLVVGQNRTASQKMHDSWLNLKVKTKLRSASRVPSSRIVVVTSSNVAYLMGLLTPIESKRAIQSIKYVNGLQKIVKMFEEVSPPKRFDTLDPYIKKRPSRQQDASSASQRKITLP